MSPNTQGLGVYPSRPPTPWDRGAGGEGAVGCQGWVPLGAVCAGMGACGPVKVGAREGTGRVEGPELTRVCGANTTPGPGTDAACQGSAGCLSPAPLDLTGPSRPMRDTCCPTDRGMHLSFSAMHRQDQAIA